MARHCLAGARCGMCKHQELFDQSQHTSGAHWTFMARHGHLGHTGFFFLRGIEKSERLKDFSQSVKCGIISTDNFSNKDNP
jgi:hypothetical protein